MKSGMNKIFGLAFVSLLCLPLAGNLMREPRSFSDLENRVLSTGVRLDRNLLKSGILAERWEAYVQDQFPMRDALVNLKSDVQVLLGNEENNGVYLGKDGYLFRRFETYSRETFLQNVDAVKALRLRLGQKLSVMAVPSSSLVLEEKLPDFIRSDEEREAFDFFSANLGKDGGHIDLLKVLERHRHEPVYFRTDHHWTPYGAFLAYEELMHSLDMEPVDLSRFAVDHREGFQGTHYSKFRGGLVKGEVFTYYQNPKADVEVRYVAEKRVENSLFFPENLDTRDKYRVFLDGNYPLVTIKNREVGKGEKVLVLRDSYANAMVPFLMESFKEVHLMDLRYYNLSLEDYIGKEDFDRVILLYGMDSYLDETSLRRLGH